ncbi:hypothetical protein C8R43DRAFT_1031770 [Mycena crocata]|nr:hypothetical protein C8R43DRAFT_1031770 [Mycena crocata]
MATFLPPPPREVIDIPDDSDDEGGEIRPRDTAPPASAAQVNTFSDFESDDDEEENELEQKPLIAPSTDIKGDFEAALQDGFDFDGVFAFSERYAIGVAPNPCLNIEGLGTVGIPLSERDARAIISASVTVCTSNGAADSSGVWELPAGKVFFDNPAWDLWIQKTAGVAASTALTAYASVRPSFTLKKLVIHEKSTHTAHFKEPISDDESNTKIGDFICILPGLFAGAQLQLRHAGQAKSLNFAHQSGLSTSIVAAYSGVEHTLSAVTTGYRLSLVYDIVQPITDVGYRPALPEMQGATQKLRNIMLSWKQDSSGEAPGWLACLLQHKYAKKSNFRAQSLTGADALLLSHLYPLARELSFRIYLAHLQVTVTTTAEAEDTGCEYGGYGGRGYGGGGRHGWGRRGYDYYGDYDDEDDDDDEEIDDGEFEDNEDDREETVTLKIVNLRGMPVDVDLDLEVDDLINGSITDEDPDTKSLEREDRTTATRTRVYKRTVLLIWPKNSDTDLTVTTGDIYDYACNALRSSLSVTPTEGEKKLVDRLLECCQTRRQEAKLQTVVQLLRESADRWNDAATLLRALKACGVDKNTDLMGVEGFVSAYQAFGWDALKDFFGDAIKNDESNTRRCTLLARLTQMAADEEDEEVSCWCKDQGEVALRSLSKMDAAQIPWLADLALSRGGEFLRDIIFPQLQAQNLDKTFWIPFIQRLQRSVGDIPNSSSSHVVEELIVQCVSETVRSLPAFPTKAVQNIYPYASYPYGYNVPDRQEKSSEAILEVIKLCVETKNEALCDGIFAKMRDATRLGAFLPGFPPWLYYAELSSSLILYMQSLPALTALNAVFQPFFADVLDAMISTRRTTSDGKAVTPCPLSAHHKTILMAATRKAGGISILKQRLNADTLKGHESSTLQDLARSIAAEFPRQQMQDTIAIQARSDVIIALVRRAIDTFDVAALGKMIPSYLYGRTQTAADIMISLVKFCFEVGAQSQCQRLLLRFVPPPPGTNVPQHVSKVLAPFLPVLRQYLASKGLDFQSDPYKMFAAAVVRAFAEKVMSQKPSEVISAAQLQGIGCQACAECRELRAFFLSDRPTISFPRVQTIRTHLERQLSATRHWGVVLETVRRGSPHTLKVTKPASMTAIGLWTANSQTGKGLLAGLGDPAMQTRILGADYPWVYARIYTGNAPAPLANASQTLNAQKRPAPGSHPFPANPAAAKKARTS